VSVEGEAGGGSRYGKGQLLFEKDCTTCHTFRSMDSVAKRCARGETLPCALCHRIEEVSEGERAVWQALKACKWVEGCYVLHNDRVVQGTKSSADFALMCKRTRRVLLAVMVDGAQHLHRNMHGTQVATQQGIDNSFDECASKQGIPVLRLHYRDLGYCMVWLDRAMSRARAGGHAGWVMCSTKFTPPTPQ
jgi:hypothetical protein